MNYKKIKKELLQEINQYGENWKNHRLKNLEDSLSRIKYDLKNEKLKLLQKQWKFKLKILKEI